MHEHLVKCRQYVSAFPLRCGKVRASCNRTSDLVKCRQCTPRSRFGAGACGRLVLVHDRRREIAVSPFPGAHSGDGKRGYRVAVHGRPREMPSVALPRSHFGAGK